MAGTGTGGHGFTINLQKVGSTTILTWYGVTITRCGFHGTIQQVFGCRKISQPVDIFSLLGSYQDRKKCPQQHLKNFNSYGNKPKYFSSETG